MSDQVSETFGYIVFCAAVVLAAWEIYTYRTRDPETDFLVTKRRLRRRSLVSAIIATIGFLLIIEARAIINIRSVPSLILFVSVLGGCAIFLLVLALLDLSETARNAQRHSTEQINEAIEREKRRLDAERGSDGNP